jgi:hypothetical protein
VASDGEQLATLGREVVTDDRGQRRRPVVVDLDRERDERVRAQRRQRQGMSRTVDRVGPVGRVASARCPGRLRR